MEFAGKVAVVTGGAKGIGRAIAGAFAANGAVVAIIGRDQAALAQASREIGAAGRRCLPLAVDLTVEAEVAAMAARLDAEFGRTDVLVTAAGMRDPSDAPFAEAAMDGFEAVVRANLLSTALPIRHLAPGMAARRQGRIVAISGVFGLRGRARHAAGVGAKWAIEGLVRSLALELGPAGVTVNAVCPGYVTGPRADAALARIAAHRGLTAEAVRAELEAETALRRLVGPDDVAEAVLFLAGERARSITGQDLVVDAGWTL